MRTLAAAAASRDRMAVSLSPSTPTHPSLSLDDPSQHPPAFQAVTPSDPLSRRNTNCSGLPPISQPLISPPSQPITTAPLPTVCSTSTNPDDPITQLENQISQLKKYGDELLELNLTESYKALNGKVEEMEGRANMMRRERARMLIGRLEGEGGWIGSDLKGLVEEEGRRLGIV
jgi:hypothetical protein